MSLIRVCDRCGFEGDGVKETKFYDPTDDEDDTFGFPRREDLCRSCRRDLVEFVEEGSA
ncbi:hypothetical protein [Halogeometricum borinquense]|uniref:hypothetical protein n=1 Tax=Halogeometricum borinquense TaxID=60847 RepID=UPI0013ED22B3|nr:hypothetical protein [Halogeometricum borinquense]